MIPGLRLVAALAALTLLAACGGTRVWAPDDQVNAAHYVDAGPPTLTLFTVISNRNGTGAHTALMVSGSQRVIFDPAGSFQHPHLPERNDVFFGVSDKAVAFYIDYHARITYHVVQQDIVVSPEVAEMALRAVQQAGPVGAAFCANATSQVLSSLPGFESIPVGMSPKKLMEAFGRLPGVTTQTFYDDDPEENGYILAGRLDDYTTEY